MTHLMSMVSQIAFAPAAAGVAFQLNTTGMVLHRLRWQPLPLASRAGQAELAVGLAAALVGTGASMAVEATRAQEQHEDVARFPEVQ